VTPSETATPKREYRRPHLSVYGRLQDRTLNNITNNMNDRMSGSFSMT
jgi:hypothetical protein